MSGFEQLGKIATNSGGLLQRSVSNLRTLQASTLLVPESLSTEKRTTNYRYLIALWLVGGAMIAMVTWVGFELDLKPRVVVPIYLIVIVLLSLLDSFISSVIFSLMVAGCLDYFFFEPIFSFQMWDVQDWLTLIAFFFTSLAITGLVRRVRQFGEVQSQQARLLDLTHDAVFVKDVNNVVRYWNRGAEELYGWKRGEAAGKITQDLLKTVFPAPLTDIDQILSRTGRWEGELVHTTRTGERVTVESRWSLQRDAEGKPIGTLESNTDITERKRAETALRRMRETFLAEAQNLSHTGSFGWNVSSGEIFWSDQCYKILGYDPASKPSIQMVLDRVHPDDIAAVGRAVEHAAEEKQDYDFEHRLLMPDGLVKHLHVVAHLVEDERRGFQFMGAVMDVTERKAAYAALEQSEQQYRQIQAKFAHAARVSTLGELTASIAHEINQPLGAIGASADAGLRWLNRPAPDLDEVRSSLERMNADARRASEIIARIRSMAARRPPERVLVSIDDLISEVSQFLRHEAQSRRVTVSYHSAAAGPKVLADRTQLQQVVVNLVVNALQAIAQASAIDRKIAISTEAVDAAAIRCTVEDSGPGIKPEHLSRLFDSFFTTKEGGMGMGLSICRSIVEAHGGRIGADNNTIHGGARFWFELRATDAAQT
jgi:PAS domain S-box-containing protein